MVNFWQSFYQTSTEIARKCWPPKLSRWKMAIIVGWNFSLPRFDLLLVVQEPIRLARTLASVDRNAARNTSGGLTPKIFHFRNNMPSFSSLAGCITFLHSCWSPFRQINNSIGNYFQPFLLLDYLLDLVRRMLQVAIMDGLNNFETRMHIVQSPVIICKTGVRICVEHSFAWETAFGHQVTRVINQQIKSIK